MRCHISDKRANTPEKQRNREGKANKRRNADLKMATDDQWELGRHLSRQKTEGRGRSFD